MVSAFEQNVLVAFMVTGITFVIALLLTYCNKRNSITREVSRKVTHIGAGTLYLALYFYNDRGLWSKYLNIFPNLLWTCMLLWTNHARSPSSQLSNFVTGIMTRNKRPEELLRGPLAFNLVTIICGTVLYKTVLGSIIMGTLTWGDGLAAVIGVRFGRQRKIYQTKSLDGLVTMFIAGMVASVVYTTILVEFQSVQMLKIGVICLIAAVVETFSPSEWDNLTIPFCIVVVYSVIF